MRETPELGPLPSGLSGSLLWFEEQYAPALQWFYREIAREQQLCLIWNAREPNWRFRLYAEMADESLARIARDLQESWKVVNHPRVRTFQLLNLGGRALEEGAEAVAQFLSSQIGIRAPLWGPDRQRITPEILAEALWRAGRGLDPEYSRLGWETVDQVDDRSPFFWLHPPRNPNAYVATVVRRNAQIHTVRFGTDAGLGTEDLDGWEVDRRSAARLERSKPARCDCGSISAAGADRCPACGLQIGPKPNTILREILRQAVVQQTEELGGRALEEIEAAAEWLGSAEIHTADIELLERFEADEATPLERTLLQALREATAREKGPAQALEAIGHRGNWSLWQSLQRKLCRRRAS